MTPTTLKTKDLAYYQQLRYTILLTPEVDGWGAWIVELPGCVGGGATPQDALAMVEDAKTAWLMSSLKHGDTIPDPLPDAAAVLAQWRQAR